MNYEYHKYANLFPMMNKSEQDLLSLSIKQKGLLNPIIIYEGEILDGRNRYQACKAAGVEPIFALYDGSDALGYAVAQNLDRRHLDSSQRAMVASRIATMDVGDNQHTPNGGTSQADAASMMNVSERAVQRATVVNERGIPELIAAVERGAVSVSAASEVASLPKENQKKILDLSEDEILNAAKEIRTERSAIRREENNAIKKEALKILPPNGLYRTIVIDPPWDMQKIERDVRPNQVEFDYPTMTQEELEEFKIPAHEQAHLYLWTTHKQLPNAFELMKKWGFGYIFTMVWHKNGGPQPFGLAQYNCEFCLFGRKGGMEFLDTKAFMVCFNAPRREHSRKPDDFYLLVERVSPGPRIDIFSREKRNGFDQYGAETEYFNGI